MNAATEFFKGADAIQKRPITEAQWADSVEYYQRVKVQTEALNDLIKALAEQAGVTGAQVRKVIKARADSRESEMRDELQGTLELLGGGDD